MVSFKILHVVEASAGGVGRHVLDLAEGCVRRGDQVDIAYGTHRAEPAFLERLDRVGVRRTFALDVDRGASPADAAAIRRVRRIVADHGPYDLVHGHSSKGGLYARAVGRRTRRVYTPNAFVTQSPEMGPVMRRGYRGVEWALARRTDGLVVVSPEERSHAAALRLRARAVELIPNGIPLTPIGDPAEARRRLGLDPDRPVIGFVGRLTAQKGLDRLLDALPLVRKHLDVVLAVIWTGEDDAALRHRADQLGLAESVRWLGRHDGQATMPAFDVLAVPSRYEGFPYVVLEALWAGVPVVGTITAGAALVLGDGRAGRLVEGTPEALAAALVEVLADHDLRGRMSVAGCEIATGHSIDAMVDATRRFYARIDGRAT